MESTAQNIEMQVRDINRLKKKITFGNISGFYHAVSTSLGFAEGMLKYGLDNSLDALTNKSNWNLQLLGGTEDFLGDITCENKPRLSIYKVFTRQAFEVHCIPWNGDREFDCPLKGRPEMDFKSWDPASMKVVFRIAQLYDFIKLYYEHGDEADLELIKCAHNISENFVEDLSKKFNTQKVHGISVHAFFEFVGKKKKAGQDIYLPTVYDFG